MIKGLSLSELAARIEANRELKQDYIAPTSAVRLAVQSDGAVVAQNEHIGSLPIQPFAHTQIAEKAGVPTRYYDRMLKDAPDLLADNVNRWFSRFPADDKRMVRTLGGDMRAFLSNRYQRIENEEIATAALTALSEESVEIVSSEVTERRMYIQVATPRLEGEVKKGDVVRAGVSISNSEVGSGAVSVQPFIYRLVCLNGMTVPARAGEGYRAFHIGRPEHEFGVMADDTRELSDRAQLLQVRDFVRAALSDATFQRTMDKMKALTEGRIEGDPAKAVEVLAKKVGATEHERGGILRSLIEGGDLSAWGLLNAVTHQAHTIKSYDRAFEFTQAGGALLDLPRSEWRQVLEAA